ncbi:MAG: DUF1553 domain-containing protein [Rhodothermales bacterium]|nr:DUF1553 domain-containing protein [Rhodothermales bacterium]
MAFTALNRKPIVLAGGAAVLALLAFGPLRNWLASPEPVAFNDEIRPILNENCLACHGGVKQAGEFSLLFEEEAFQPNKSGKPAIVRGHADSSELVVRLLHADPEERMPFEHPPLADEDITLLKRWIEEGATWETHWAYVPPTPAGPPDPRNASWARTGIDRFILARLEAEGLRPSPEADCSALLRRVSLDLTGLPPTPAEADAFCADRSSDAYERVVDRLLASAHYGERWAAMWMDLARYADSKGYEKDDHRSIWKYRDWLIDAFNADMPFDQFTIEQLAGDLLPAPSESQLLATAFHRNTMNNDEGGTDDEEFRTAAVIDRVNTTWEVWMGTTMACVQCHSHPYDAFRHEDYYTSLAFFNNTADRDQPDEAPTLGTFADSVEGTLAGLIDAVMAAEKTAPLPDNALWADRREHALYPDGRLIAGDADSSQGVSPEGTFIISIQHGGFVVFEDVEVSGKDALSLSYSSAGQGGYVDVRLDRPDGPSLGRFLLEPTNGWGNYITLRMPLSRAEGTHDLYFRFERRAEGSLFNIHWFYLHDAVDHLSSAARDTLLQQRLALEALAPEADTPILRELAGEAKRTTRIFNRGNWMDPGEAVEPAVPGALPALPPDAPRDRLGLARWIVSDTNPLTARVIVNRFWEQLFGQGIVPTLEDFGSQGDRPSHPELLDWLALEFIHTHDWSVKSLLKAIVVSAAYRQSSDVTPALIARDPQNTLLARGPRVRLAAEEIRDQALFVSGLLSAEIGGPSVYPYQPDGIWRVPYSNAKWETSAGGDQHRRGVYTYWRRSSPYPSMITFDSPSREFCVSRRISTNTPLQALVTLNDPVYVEAAEYLAGRMKSEGGETLEARLRHGYRLALARDPLPDELAVLVGLYKDAYFEFDVPSADGPVEVGPVSRPDDPEVASLMVVANAILNLDAFLTKS